MLMKRIVACLDVANGRVVKGTQFENLRDIGDPVEMAAQYEAQGADEIVFLDIAANREARSTLLDVVRRTAERVFIPLTVGGGIRTVDDITAALRAGADKVSINSAAVASPEIIDMASQRFGAQCVVASIDAKRVGQDWRVFVRGGRTPTDLDAVAWAGECARRGAGEVMLTSIDRDGSRTGYDLELTRAIAAAVSIPIVASGGAGSAVDVRDVLVEGCADAALVAGILHDGLVTIAEIKQLAAKSGLAIRSAA